jgi:hypothetical protein
LIIVLLPVNNISGIFRTRTISTIYEIQIRREGWANPGIGF